MLFFNNRKKRIGNHLNDYLSRLIMSTNDIDKAINKQNGFYSIKEG